MESIAAELGNEHRQCDELFTHAENHVSMGDWDQASVSFSEFLSSMDKHFRMEEEILFPRFEEITGMTSGPTQVMRTEHAQIRDLMHTMSDALERRDQDEYLGSSRNLVDYHATTQHERRGNTLPHD